MPEVLFYMIVLLNVFTLNFTQSTSSITFKTSKYWKYCGDTLLPWNEMTFYVKYTPWKGKILPTYRFIIS